MLQHTQHTERDGLMQNADERRLEVGNEYLKPQTFQFEAPKNGVFGGTGLDKGLARDRH